MINFLLGFVFFFCLQVYSIFIYIERDIAYLNKGKDPLECNQMKNAQLWEKIIDVGFYNFGCAFAKGSGMEEVYCGDKK